MQSLPTVTVMVNIFFVNFSNQQNESHGSFHKDSSGVEGNNPHALSSAMEVVLPSEERCCVRIRVSGSQWVLLPYFPLLSVFLSWYTCFMFFCFWAYSFRPPPRPSHLAQLMLGPMSSARWFKGHESDGPLSVGSGHQSGSCEVEHQLHVHVHDIRVHGLWVWSSCSPAKE